jgi:microcystin-dependent protein
MIKPESNAPVSMQPWVRTTNNQIEQIETAIAKINSLVNGGSASVDHEQNQSISNTFSFTPLEDGSTETTAGSINFNGAINSSSDISMSGSLVVGDPSRQEYNAVTEESIGSIPNLKVIPGQLEINPVTELEYYTTGQFNITDTTMNIDGYGLINGNGLQITLANDGELERQNIAILGVSGDGVTVTFQIENNESNVAVYTAGKYVNVTGIPSSGYNGNNLLITSVNTGVSPMEFTVYGEAMGTSTGGGYVTINQPNSIYEGKISVQGPSPDYTGVTVNQTGVHIGVDGGAPEASSVKLDSTGLTAPSAFINEAVINGTRLFISDTAPTAVNDGDIWLDKAGIFTGSSGSTGGIPTGSIMMWYTATPPSGWIFCQGQSTSGYPALAAVIGATVPDMRGRVPVGPDAGAGRNTTFNTLGESSGSMTNTHQHFTMVGNDGNIYIAQTGTTVNGSTPASRVITGPRGIIGGAGLGVAAMRQDATYDTTIDIRQPFLNLNFIIKL